MSRGKIILTILLMAALVMNFMQMVSESNVDAVKHEVKNLLKEAHFNGTRHVVVEYEVKVMSGGSFTLKVFTDYDTTDLEYLVINSTVPFNVTFNDKIRYTGKTYLKVNASEIYRRLGFTWVSPIRMRIDTYERLVPLGNTTGNVSMEVSLVLPCKVRVKLVYVCKAPENLYRIAPNAFCKRIVEVVREGRSGRYYALAGFFITLVSLIGLMAIKEERKKA